MSLVVHGGVALGEAMLLVVLVLVLVLVLVIVLVLVVQQELAAADEAGARGALGARAPRHGRRAVIPPICPRTSNNTSAKTHNHPATIPPSHTALYHC